MRNQFSCCLRITGVMVNIALIQGYNLNVFISSIDFHDDSLFLDNFGEHLEKLLSPIGDKITN